MLVKEMLLTYFHTVWGNLVINLLIRYFQVKKKRRKAKKKNPKTMETVMRTRNIPMITETAMRKMNIPMMKERETKLKQQKVEMLEEMQQGMQLEIQQEMQQE